MQDKESKVKVKGMLTVVLLIVTVLLLQTTGLAINLDYSGPINSFTGEPVNESGVPGNEDWIPITSNIYYDRAEQAYIYDLGSFGIHRYSVRSIYISIRNG